MKTTYQRGKEKKIYIRLIQIYIYIHTTTKKRERDRDILFIKRNRKMNSSTEIYNRV